jgi:hypothetical protein
LLYRCTKKKKSSCIPIRLYDSSLFSCTPIIAIPPTLYCASLATQSCNIIYYYVRPILSPSSARFKIILNWKEKFHRKPYDSYILDYIFMRYIHTASCVFNHFVFTYNIIYYYVETVSVCHSRFRDIRVIKRQKEIRRKNLYTSYMIDTRVLLYTYRIRCLSFIPV